MTFKEFIISLVIGLLINTIWLGLEILIYGEIKPNKADDIMMLILWISLFLNYKSIKEDR